MNAKASPRRPVLRRTMLAAAAALGLGAALAQAQVVPAPAAPQIGSSNPVTAAPPVARPHRKPCIVPLFQNLQFADFNAHDFSYSPPASCPGPWAKVVFTADFTVTAGRQFDRTAAFYLGHASLYYGTTAEPRATLSPSWHVERDITDLTALLREAQAGEARLDNFIGVSAGVTYNGVIFASAALEFYPAGGHDAPPTPDLVVPVTGTSGEAGTLATTASSITQTLNLPRNVERAYLDLIAQSQSNDEFWYFCVPSDEATNLESCGNSPFRETEITIDGQPAGVAPVYPWIYTGGIDPYLWEPIPGVQTLDFRPYRVDLTPFAGVLADGNPHVLGVSVFNANSYFLATANLLIYTDHGRRQVSGGLLSNTLAAAPTPVVKEDIKSDAAGTTFTGTIAVTANRQFAISGYVDTSHGRVQTTLEQSVGFLNTQQFDVGPTRDTQNVQQFTTVDSRVSTRGGNGETSRESHASYPLAINYSFVFNPDGSVTQTTSVDQRDLEFASAGGAFGFSTLSNEVRSTDTLNYDASGNFLGPSGGRTSQTYSAHDADTGCYSRTLTAQAQKLTAVTDGASCPGHPH